MTLRNLLDDLDLWMLVNPQQLWIYLYRPQIQQQQGNLGGNAYLRIVSSLPHLLEYSVVVRGKFVRFQQPEKLLIKTYQ